MFKSRISMMAACAMLAVGGMSLAACDTTDQANQAAGQVQAKVTELQNVAKTVCGFVPNASTAANIIGTLTGLESLTVTITDLAKGFCSAVTSPGARKGGKPVYRGVVLSYKRASS